ncbi:MAG: hypothetical protein WEB13_07825 [Dehalococcoidia bacterium]
MNDLATMRRRQELLESLEMKLLACSSPTDSKAAEQLEVKIAALLKGE